jgi:hypothetical protein
MVACRIVCFICLITVLFAGLPAEALAKRPIRYYMGDIPPSGVTRLKNVTLDIEPFEDARQTVPENQITFTADRKTKIDGKTVCVNTEKDYREDVGRQIAATIATHFQKRGAFKDVPVGSKAVAKYYLKGTVRQFYGQQDFSTTKAVGSAFGVLGLLATAAVKTPGIVRLEFTHLELMDKNGTPVKAFKDINQSFEEEFPSDANCLMTHVNVLEKMKVAIQAFADEVEKTILETESAADKDGASKTTN